MSNPIPTPQDPQTDSADWDPTVASPEGEKRTATSLVYVPPPAQCFDIPTLEQWIDLCA